MGPYCKFCDNRCFVHFPDNTPDYILRAYGTCNIIATCRGGQRFEKEKIGYCYDDIMVEISKMNKFVCATCGTEHIGDIPDSWITRGEPQNEIHYCSRACLEKRIFESDEWQDALREALADIGETLDDEDTSTD